MKKILFAFTLSFTFIWGGWYIATLKTIDASKFNNNKYENISKNCHLNYYHAYGYSYTSNKTYSQNYQYVKYLATDNDEYLSFKDGQSLNGIFAQHGISSAEIFALSKALYPYVRPSEISANDEYKFTLTHTEDNKPSLASFTIRRLDQNNVLVTYQALKNQADVGKVTFSITLSRPEITVIPELIELKVYGSLFKSFIQIPFGNQLMQRLQAIMTWKMNLPNEVLEGDQVEILVDHKFADGKLTGYGKIKSVIYTQQHRTISAQFFSSQDNKINGYFDENGVSLEKEFLVSPVYETSTTSNQQLRFHPVIKAQIRHNGIDFAGLIGTDFFCIADGEVVEKRFDKNVGNMIRVRHQYGVHTEYFHADSLEAKLLVGSKVKRGQRLGTIGRTGKMCTGPHLHLGMYLKNGEKRNFITLASLKNKLKNAPNIPANYITEYKSNSVQLSSLIKSKKEILAKESQKKAIAIK